MKKELKSGILSAADHRPTVGRPSAGLMLSRFYAPPTLDGELWRYFLTVLNSRRYFATSYELWRYEESCVRQPTTYGEFSTRCDEFITRSKS